MRCSSDPGPYRWVEVEAFPLEPERNCLLLTTRDIGESRVIRKILDIFVYKNYDYLLMIDINHNSYMRITDTGANTPVPSKSGTDYTKDMEEFNRRYVAPEDVERVTANMQLPHVIAQLEASNVYSFTSSGVTINGTYRRSRNFFLYYDKEAGKILNARTDITQIYLEEQAKNQRLAEALRDAHHDSLTGLYNRRATADLVSRSLDSRYRSLAAFLFIDVDNFKAINDTYGHQKGDELLCLLARAVEKLGGREGIAGRIGGDEFLLYLPSPGGMEEIGHVALQICGIFNHMENGFPQEHVSCSVGVSVYPRDGTIYEILLQKADLALYASKRSGKNRFAFYSPEACGTFDAAQADGC